MNNTQVFIFHHAFDKPIAAILRKNSGENLHVEFIERSILSKLKLQDPVLIFIPLDNTYSIKSGDVDGIINEEELAVIVLDMADKMQDLRAYKRYPASQFCDIREVYTKKKGTAILKDISSQGMLLVSKNNFQLGDAIETSIYFGTAIYLVEGKVVRKIEGKEYSKYGIMVKKTDVSSIKCIREFMSLYQCEFIKSIDYNLANQANNLDLVFDFFDECDVDKRLSYAALKLDKVLRSNR